jgi:hypothetical protein
MAMAMGAGWAIQKKGLAKSKKIRRIRIVTV